jgi:acyl carrier protein
MAKSRRSLSNAADLEIDIVDTLREAGVPHGDVERLINVLKPKFKSLLAAPTQKKSRKAVAPSAGAQPRTLTIFEQEFVEMSRDALLAKLREFLIETLGVDAEEVTESARLEADLGAESIDYLDLVFRIERAFSIKIKRGELFSINDIVYENEAYRRVEEGERPSDDKVYVTQEGLEALKQRLPHLDVDAFANDPNLARASDMHTVASVVRFLELRQQELRGNSEDAPIGNSHVRMPVMP